MSKEQIGVLVEEELKEKIEDQLGYNDSMSGWVRGAIIEKLEKEGLIEEGNSNLRKVAGTTN